MKAESIMSKEVQCVSPDMSIARAAQIMREIDVGSLPICENDRLAGMVTDRDIVIRAVAEGRNPHDVPVKAVMSEKIIYGYADQEVSEIAKIMEDHQIRRLPLLNRQKRLVGLVATADLALNASEGVTAEVMKDVSTPAAKGH